MFIIIVISIPYTHFPHRRMMYDVYQISYIGAATYSYTYSYKYFYQRKFIKPKYNFNSFQEQSHLHAASKKTLTEFLICARGQMVKGIYVDAYIYRILYVEQLTTSKEKPMLSHHVITIVIIIIIKIYKTK